MWNTCTYHSKSELYSDLFGKDEHSENVGLVSKRKYIAMYFCKQTAFTNNHACKLTNKVGDTHVHYY